MIYHDGKRISSISGLAIDLTPEDTIKFAQLTKKNLSRQLAISIDGTFCCAPTIRDEIKGGRISISGAKSLIEQTYKLLKQQLAPPEDSASPPADANQQKVSPAQPKS
ncbi:MAG: hypothetical protein RRY34_00545 [Victivallaceae bacterium]